MHTARTIIKPLITEKSTRLSKSSRYTFQVNPKTSKDQIRTELESIYGVTIATIRTIIRKGKEKRVGRRMKPKQMPNIKIAYVTLSKGVIESFPQS